MTSEQQAHIARDCQEVLAEGHRTLEPLRNSRVLITGGTGFLGTWLAELASHLNDSYQFNINLILLSSHAQAFAERAPALVSRRDVVLIEGDVRHAVEIPDDVSWIVHAASSPDSRLHVSDPLRTIDVSVNGTTTLLAAAARLPNLKKILHISSGLVYGAQPSDVPGIAEDSWGALAPCALGSVYAEAKRCAETVCTAYRNEQRLPIVTARPFAYIGSHQLLDKPWAVNNFLHDALLGGPIRILGDPNTVRSYLYASDMAFWIWSMLANGSDGQSFNVGSPQAVTLRELAEKIGSLFPQKIPVSLPHLHKDACPGARFVPDVTRAQTGLGLRVSVDLDAAVRRTLSWHQQAARTEKD